ncbi:hypothetical protein BN2476_170077 [Paraburkholderia piptadeniae]|uniref:Uncharacterized protein n=1 Tax=Paraburkholderia piptadeniae TaxID=1701573 RepID=A0A1N7RT75_9BURK|nr:hypothetical protein BN2476_170077 [Paraburkholderia piptadeniae]
MRAAARRIGRCARRLARVSLFVASRQALQSVQSAHCVGGLAGCGPLATVAGVFTKNLPGTTTG